MLNRLASFFLLHPKGLIVAGNTLSLAAFVVLMLGAIAHVYTSVIAAIHLLGRQVRQEPTLADLVTGLPTWWVPETVTGIVFVILVALTGAWIAHVGRDLERFLRT